MGDTLAPRGVIGIMTPASLGGGSRCCQTASKRGETEGFGDLSQSPIMYLM